MFRVNCCCAISVTKHCILTNTATKHNTFLWAISQTIHNPHIPRSSYFNQAHFFNCNLEFSYLKGGCPLLNRKPVIDKTAGVTDWWSGQRTLQTLTAVKVNVKPKATGSAQPLDLQSLKPKTETPRDPGSLRILEQMCEI